MYLGKDGHNGIANELVHEAALLNDSPLVRSGVNKRHEAYLGKGRHGKG